ncbi:copper homeostasis membrane protein CopD [Burkholderia gladioli]|uniref:copper homeostasis membrane protein CopD n=1 Tax=Burkholderia gladioli TaxID=28095 RepID=UPI0016413BC5|nr:copper homeostasis membrane protein CopD [Burkholderia gladioli]
MSAMDGALNIAIRFVLYAAAMLLAGLPLFALHALRREERGAPWFVVPFTRVLAGAAWLGLIASVAALVVMTRAMSGSDDLDANLDLLGALLGGTAFGSAWFARVLTCLGACCLARRLARRPAMATFAAAAAAGLVVLGSLAWGGHAVMDDGRRGVLHLMADLVHLAAAAIWLDALGGFAIQLAAGGMTHIETLVRTLAQFATVGSAAVAALIATGMVNTVMVVGWPLVRFPDSSYGRVLLVKLVLFCAMLGLAASNRYRLAPGLEARLRSGCSSGAMASLRGSLLLELVCAMALLLAVAVLGVQEPR